MKKGLAVWESKKERARLAIGEKVKKRKERGSWEEFYFLFFIFVQGSVEREYFKKEGEGGTLFGHSKAESLREKLFGFPCSFRIVAVSILRCFVHLNGHFINKKSLFLFMTSLSFIWMHDAWFLLPLYACAEWCNEDDLLSFVLYKKKGMDR